MADTSVAIKDATGTTVPIDVFTVGGDARQTVVIGDSNSTNVLAVRGNGEIPTGYAVTTASGTITVADTGSASSTTLNGLTFTGTATANSFVQLSLTGQASYIVQFSGTATATLRFDESYDNGVSWVPGTLFLWPGTAATQSTPYSTFGTVNNQGVFIGDCSGATHVRVRATAYTSGTVSVIIAATGAAAGPKLSFNVSGPKNSSSTTVGTVTATTSNTTLLGANPARLYGTIFNDSSSVLYVRLGTTAASLTDYSFQVAAQTTYEIPAAYAGQLNAVWKSATGLARITEVF